MKKKFGNNKRIDLERGVIDPLDSIIQQLLMWTYVDIQENNKQIDLERGVIDPVPLNSINNPTIVVDFQETFSNVVELMLTSIKQGEKPWKNILNEKNHENMHKLCPVTLDYRWQHLCSFRSQ
jgi:hypothetical protein